MKKLTEEEFSRKQEVQELQKKLYETSKQLDCYKFVIEKLASGVILVDEKGVVFGYNKVASELEGLAINKVVGRPVKEMFFLENDVESRFMTVMTSKVEILNDYSTYTTEDNVSVKIVQSYYPIIKDGVVIGSCSILNETDRLESLIDQITAIKKRVTSKAVDYQRKEHEAIIGNSEAMLRVKVMAKRYAEADTDVLITGESGTGKELAAKLVHSSGPKRSAPFIPVNCAAIPENLIESILFGTKRGAFTGAENTTGLFESADNGTLFLDELNSMNLMCQAKLLRAIQEKKIRKVGDNKEISINCNVIATINKDPWECIRNGTLREDLFYRLSLACIAMPPVRERRGDIAILAKHFLNTDNKKYNKQIQTIDQEVLDLFERYEWKGNVRELKNVVESMVILCDENSLKLYHLSDINRKQLLSTDTELINVGGDGYGSLPEIIMQKEEEIIKKVLSETKGNKTKAAAQMGISPQVLNYKLKKYGIEAD